MSETSDVVLQFVRPQERTEIKPLMERAHAGYDPDRCRHETFTFRVNVEENRITCGGCLAPVEAIEVVKKFLDREWARGRHENAALWQRKYAEQEAEKQAAKTRKAAYATLFRFAVTPEMYAEEYRRNALVVDLALKKDYTKTLPFTKEGKEDA